MKAYFRIGRPDFYEILLFFQEDVDTSKQNIIAEDDSLLCYENPWQIIPSRQLSALSGSTI